MNRNANIAQSMTMGRITRELLLLGLKPDMIRHDVASAPEASNVTIDILDILEQARIRAAAATTAAQKAAVDLRAAYEMAKTVGKTAGRADAEEALRLAAIESDYYDAVNDAAIKAHIAADAGWPTLKKLRQQVGDSD